MTIISSTPEFEAFAPRRNLTDFSWSGLDQPTKANPFEDHSGIYQHGVHSTRLLTGWNRKCDW